MNADNNGIVIIGGPTAVGKSDIAVELAKRIGGEIISADALQVYRGMDIGTAKMTIDEQAGIKHYLIDIIDPREEFNVSIFKTFAEKAIEEICAKGKIPIITGGTGFYIQALLKDVDFSEDTDKNDEFRKEAVPVNEGVSKEEFRIFISKYFFDNRKIKSLSGEEKNLIEDAFEKESPLYGILKVLDLKSAQNIHEKNVKRVIRALEYYIMSGEMISLHNENERNKSPAYKYIYFVLNDERAKLYDRINKRVDKMVEAGLIEEVIKLKEKGVRKEMTSMQGIGYKEVYEGLDKGTPEEEIIEEIKKNTRHFAKRQITWFKREEDVIWLNWQEFNYSKEDVLDEMIKRVNEKL